MKSLFLFKENNDLKIDEFSLYLQKNKELVNSHFEENDIQINDLLSAFNDGNFSYFPFNVEYLSL